MGLEAVAEQLFLDLNGLLNGQADAAVDGLLAVADRNGSILGDLAGQLQRSGHQLLLRVDGVDQTNAQGLVCLDVQGRVYELLGHAHADKACQTLGAAEARGDTQTDFRLTKDGIVGAEADVAAHGQLIAAAQREAVDSSDDGQREALDHQENVVAQLAESLALGLGHRGHRANVGTGHEALVTGTGQDDAADGVLVDGLKSGLQVSQNFRVQRVQRLRTVDRQDSNGVLNLSSNKGHYVFLR